MVLSELQKLIADYISGVIQEEHPEIPTDPGSSFNDLFIAPLISIMSPFLSEFNRLDLNQDLGNAVLMTKEDLDNIGQNNYFISRQLGQRATTTVTVFMDPSFATSSVLIPPITVSNGSLKYSAVTSTFVKLVDSSVPDSYATVLPGVLSNYLNPATQKYEIPIYVVAEKPGVDYNVDTGKINTLLTKYPFLNDTVTNYIKVSNGTTDEDNVAYVERIGKVYLTKNLGTDIGYREFILSTFASVIDLIIVGYGDSEMTRDVLVDTYGVPSTSHIGGKVDIYIKGTVPTSFTQAGFIKSGKFQLLHPNLDTSVGLSAINLTEYTRVPTYHITYQYPGVDGAASTGNIYVIIDNPDQLEAHDCIQIQYNAFANVTDIQSKVCTDIFYFNSNKLRLAYTPFTSVTSLLNAAQATIPSTAFTLVKVNDAMSVWRYDSSTEPIDLVVNDISQYTTEDLLTVTGVYNSIIGTIQESLNSLGNRIITADVMIKQCPRKFINVGLNIGLQPHYTLGVYEKSRILSIVQEAVEGSPIGGTIQSSDILHLLNTDTSTKPFVDFIQTPIILFDSTAVPTDSDSIFMGKLSYVATSASGEQLAITTKPGATALGVPQSNTTLIEAPTLPPVLSAVDGPTELEAGNYTACYSYQNLAGQTTTGPSASITIEASQAIHVDAIALPTGVTTINYFLSTAVNSFNQTYIAATAGDAVTLTFLPSTSDAQMPLGNSTVVSNPTLSPVLTGVDGATSIQAGAYSLAYSFTNTIGETMVGPVANISLRDYQVLQVAPITLPAGVTGVKYYITTPNYERINSMITMERIGTGDVGRVVIERV